MATYCNFTDYTYLQDLSGAHKANTSVMLWTFVVIMVIINVTILVDKHQT